MVFNELSKRAADFADVKHWDNNVVNDINTRLRVATAAAAAADKKRRISNTFEINHN